MVEGTQDYFLKSFFFNHHIISYNCMWIYNYFKTRSLNFKKNLFYLSKQYKMDLEVKWVVKAVMLYPEFRRKVTVWLQHGNLIPRESPPFPRQAPSLSACLAHAHPPTPASLHAWNANPTPFFWFQSRPSNSQEISPWSSPHPLSTPFIPDTSAFRTVVHRGNCAVHQTWRCRLSRSAMIE